MADQLPRPASRAVLPDPDDELARWILLGDEDEEAVRPPVAPTVDLGPGRVHRIDAEAFVAHVRERRTVRRGGWGALVTAAALGEPVLGGATVRLAGDPALAAAALVQGSPSLPVTGRARLLVELARGLDPAHERLALVGPTGGDLTRLCRTARRAGRIPVRALTVAPGVMHDPVAFDRLELELFEAESTIVVPTLPTAHAGPLVLALRDVLPEAWFVTLDEPGPGPAPAAGGTADALRRSGRLVGAGARLIRHASARRRRPASERSAWVDSAVATDEFAAWA